MKKIRSLFFIIIAILILPILLCEGCSGKQETPKHYILTEYLSSDETVRDNVKDLKEAKIFEDVFLNEGQHVEIVATPKQAEEQIRIDKQQFKEIVTEYEKDSGNKIEYSSNFDTITLYAETSEWLEEFTTDLGIIIMNSEMIQVFSGKPNWHLKIKFIRPSDGKVLLSETYPDNENITFGGYLWDETEETE